MNDPSAIVARLEKLERDNLRLKAGLVAALLLLTSIPLVGAVLPVQVPDVIKARQFVVVDERSTVQVGMSAGGVGFFDTKENVIRGAWMGADGITYCDDNGICRVGITANGINYADETGLIRAAMGAIDPRVDVFTGIEARYPAMFMLWDADGNVTWRALP